jgi:phosphoglycerate dehydrogenase-like enzyme
MAIEKPLVLITDYLEEADIENPVLESCADIKILNTHTDTDIDPYTSKVKGILVFHDIKISARIIAKLDQCKGIVRCGVGYDNVDIKAAGEKGIAVCNVPDYGTEEVADHAVMLLLAIARRLIPCYDDIRSGGWQPNHVFGAPRLRGKTIGLIGCGRIGTAAALRFKALGLRVLFYDPFATPGLDKAIGMERCNSLEDMLPQCLFVSVHTPLTPKTKHIVNDASLALLPKGAYLVNTARGPCVSGDAVVRALESGQLAYAALDVVEKEPLDDERLRKHPKVLLTPHSAFYSVEGFIEMRRKGAEEVRRLVLDQPVVNLVNGHCLTNPRFKLPLSNLG